MDELKLGVVETKFAELVWANAPISSGELVKLCAKELEWKKSTTYTVLKKLCEKGLFENDGGTVVVRMDRQQYLSAQSRQFVEDAFKGSLPAFLAAFGSGKRLPDTEIDELQRIIDGMRGESDDQRV